MILFIFLIIPEHIQYFSIRVYPDEHIRYGDELELCVFCIRKVHFRFPDGFDEVGVVQVEYFCDFRVFQSFVLPLLPKIKIYFVVL